MTAAIDTRRLYSFEDSDEYFPWLDDLQPMHVLRRLAWRIWEECPTGRCWSRPSLSAGRGTRHGPRLTSFTEGNRITLVPRQRTRRILIHEMVHVIGPVGHGSAFVECYVRLLVRYGRQQEDLLRLRMATIAGVRA